MDKLFFMLIDIIQIFRPKDFTVVHVEDYCEYQITDYFYGGRVYKCIGGLEKDIRRGFFVPIKSVHWNDTDVTDYVKAFSGPRNDFYGKDPDISKMFYTTIRHKWVPSFSIRPFGISVTWHKKKVVRPIQGQLTIRNILNQTTVFGAK
jgi:hypothetical protein